MEIRFSNTASVNWERESIQLYADVDGTPVACLIPGDYLTSPKVCEFGDGQESLALFNKSRGAIESQLRTQIESQGYDAHGSIILPVPVGIV